MFLAERNVTSFSNYPEYRKKTLTAYVSAVKCRWCLKECRIGEQEMEQTAAGGMAGRNAAGRGAAAACGTGRGVAAGGGVPKDTNE